MVKAPKKKTLNGLSSPINSDGESNRRSSSTSIPSARSMRSSSKVAPNPNAELGTSNQSSGSIPHPNSTAEVRKDTPPARSQDKTSTQPSKPNKTKAALVEKKTKGTKLYSSPSQYEKKARFAAFFRDPPNADDIMNQLRGKIVLLGILLGITGSSGHY